MLGIIYACAAQTLTIVKTVRPGPTYFSAVTSSPEGLPMTTPNQTDQTRIPVMQQILDNPFLLLFIGVTIPTVLYILWGVMEIASIPLAN
jgi:hypothetical protein